MKVELVNLDPGKLCAVYVNRREAVQLIQSLTNQLLAGSPNSGRLESPCKGDATEVTIMVMEGL